MYKALQGGPQSQHPYKPIEVIIKKTQTNIRHEVRKYLNVATYVKTNAQQQQRTGTISVLEIAQKLFGLLPHPSQGLAYATTGFDDPRRKNNEAKEIFYACERGVALVAYQIL